MKRILTIALFFIGLTAMAQPYNNEWIRFPQTYYKFKVVNEGLYRIPKSILDAAGIGGVGAQYFELWRNGKQVPIYTSTASGPLASDGYIEFWGQGNDGKPDQALYRDPAYQHTTAINLITDTAVYFLSVNTTGAGFTYYNVGNDVASNSLPAEPYFIDKAAKYYRNKINLGFAAVVGEYFYSASYDKGEFWSSDAINPATALVTTMSGLNVYSGGPDATLKYGAMGDALNPRNIKVSVNNSQLVDTAMDYFTDINSSVQVPLSLVTSGTAAVQFTNTSLVGTDRMVISYFELTYPRTFNFNNQSSYKFSLPASGDKYLEITNFNYGSVAPVLLNLTTGERITGDISSPGMVRFVVAGGGARDFVLVSEDPANINLVSTLASKTFKKFTDPGNQGDFLIISNKALFTGSNGNNPVIDYKNYRSSAVGGSYNAQVIDIDELIDQFAFGIKEHPSSIKNFLRYARDKFSSPIKYVFLMGRGVNYVDYQKHQSEPAADQLDLVPTFGNPGSDNMLSSADAASSMAITPIGRLSVVHGSEIEDYLQKIKEYESAQKNLPNTIDARSWMKNIVHVTGSTDPYLGTVLCNYMAVYRGIIEDTTYGGMVQTFCKASTNAIEQINNQKIGDLFAQGISILTYFGHSSTTTLEFNLDNPENYNNQGKYPVFFVNGCDAGDFFTYNTTRLLVNETLSEKFTLAKERGGIAFVASTHYGIVNYLNIYLNNLYGLISRKDYGESLGETVRDALHQMVVVTGGNDYYARSHAEEMTVHGDPSIHINQEAKPDYVIEDPQVIINPSFISVAEQSFQVKVRMYNLGRAVNDSIYLNINRQYPDGTSALILHKKIAGIRYSDSLTIDVPIVATRDKGANKITATIDADNAIDEISESNNSATKDMYIFEDEARPVFPYEYSIVNDPGQKLYASTADPFSVEKNYVIEADTTALFNSPFKVNKTILSKGGVLEFAPGIVYKDSTVYYWRVSVAPLANEDYRWSNSSFVYISGTDKGFNQSHYFQHENSDLSRITLASDRTWKYLDRSNNLFFRLGTFATSALTESDMSITVNNDGGLIHNTCNFSSLVFNVFDPVTFKPWVNVTDSTTGKGMYKSERSDCYPGRQNNFEYIYTDSASRKNAMDFMDMIPDGTFVSVRAMVLDPASFPSQPQNFINDWMKDTLVYGSNNSLYHRLYAQGFTDLDSFYKVRPWIFFYKKNKQEEYSIHSAVAKGTFDILTLSVDCNTPDTLGYITSPKFGPAKDWKKVIWRGKSLETLSQDNPQISVIGIDNNQVETTLYTLDKNTQDFDISNVSAAQYPYMKLKMRNIDSVTLTPYQLNYWRIYYTPVPEGSLAGNLFLSSKDTLETGEPLNFGIAFKNISDLPFDSIKVKASVVDKNNVTHNITMPRTKPLIAGDTTRINFQLDSKDFTETNTLFLDVNPDSDQVEQYHFNNFLYKNFFVRTDQTNPLLDITFDGVHILNKDLVSAKPHIQIKLKDEAKFLLLNDTSLSSVQLRYPDGTIRTQTFDNDTLRFTPATSGSDNTATVDFYPQFTKQYNADGDEYELIVTGKDRSGNKAGQQYRIAFTIISKPMISNLLNYPNPFSTSTAFVFTLTGSDIPQNMKIQILTVTGKIVREITKDELGPIHIGRNITDFKWDGTDQFGQKLGNGVYIYRFVTSLNGRRMDKYKAEGDNTDMYFNNGYGKMYLMH